jgi:hypothetical protein
MSDELREEMGMIFYRSLLDDIIRRDQRYCGDCGNPFRAAFKKAAEQGDWKFLSCLNCSRHWTPSPDIDEAARGWMLVFVPDDPVPAAVICAHCAAAYAEPTTLPSIAYLVLSQTRGPAQ